MREHTYFMENSPVNSVINKAYDSIGEEGFLSLFTRDYAVLSDTDKFYVMDVILSDYQISITEFILKCFDEYASLFNVVETEFKRAKRLYLSDADDQLAVSRYKTWAIAKERLKLQIRLLTDCISDHSAHLSYDLENEIKNYL